MHAAIGLIVTFATGIFGLIIGPLVIILSIYGMYRIRKNSQITDIQHRLKRLEEGKK